MFPTTNGITVLLAEDDDGHADLIQGQLRDVGLVNTIIRFKDGQELMDFLAQRTRGNFYVVLLDIRMPRKDGIQVLQEMKSDESLRKIPVIMLTTTDDPREVERCYRLGCNSYITKPLGFEAFMEAVKRLGLFIMVVKVPQVDGIEA